MAAARNPLVSDAFVDFLLYDVLDAESLTKHSHFSDHDRGTFDLWVQSCRRLAREKLWPAYRAMDESPATLVDGRIRTHEIMKDLWSSLAGNGTINATRPYAVGGQQLPQTVATAASVYLLAANCAATSFAGLTTGAAHLIEAFGDERVRELFLSKLYDGTFNGTMALTEPHAGSSLADLTSAATARGDGTFSIKGSKIFISGGDQSFASNTVHMVLARIEGSPAGTRGVSLFAVPRERRTDDGGWEPNDVHVAGAIHKIGWKGVPSLALSFGDEGDCRGWLVGAPNHGLKCMFQMMNEARLLVGASAAATASVAFHESLAYARERTQGRKLGDVDPRSKPVALTEHPDVRRMLLAQKCISEGAIALVSLCARYADTAEHHESEAERERAQLLLDLLTPIAKTFPAERGFESNVYAVQIHGGYGYSSEYLPEAWMRDQKLNSIHEGTTQIQALDLLGRKVIAKGGEAIAHFRAEIDGDLSRALNTGVSDSLVAPVRAALDRWLSLTESLAAKGLAGDVMGMMGHATDYLDATSVLVLGWLWVKMAAATAAREGDFYEGIRAAARYWVHREVPRLATIAAVIESGEDSYTALDERWL
jgi:alkylation response protein AidB-like acyl-CoA dehydrogenase